MPWSRRSWHTALVSQETRRRKARAPVHRLWTHTVLKVGDDALKLVLGYHGLSGGQSLDVETGVPPASACMRCQSQRWRSTHRLRCAREDTYAHMEDRQPGKTGSQGGGGTAHRCQSLRLCSASSWREANTTPGAVFDVNAPVMAPAGPSLRAAQVREFDATGPRRAMTARREGRSAATTRRACHRRHSQACQSIPRRQYISEDSN